MCTCDNARVTGEHCDNCETHQGKPCNCAVSNYGRDNRDGH